MVQGFECSDERDVEGEGRRIVAPPKKRIGDGEPSREMLPVSVAMKQRFTWYEVGGEHGREIVGEGGCVCTATVCGCHPRF